MAQKGFKAKKQPTKKQVQSENTQLAEALEQLQTNMQFIGQQLYATSQRVQALDKEVGAMANLLRMASKTEAAAEGDSVMIDFAGIIKETGKTFKGGNAMGTVVNIGSKSFVPGFEEALIGAQLGETKTITVTFPETYPEELKEKEAEFTVKVKKIWTPQENDEEIAMLHADRLKKEQEAEEKAKAKKEGSDEASEEESAQAQS